MDVEASVEKTDFVVMGVSAVDFRDVLTRTVWAGGCLSGRLCK